MAGETAQTPTNQAAPTAPPAGTDGLASLGLALDLGPQPPLSTHTQAKVKASTPLAGAKAATRRAPAGRWGIGMGSLGVAAAVVFLLFGYGLIGSAGSKGNGTAKRSSSTSVANRQASEKTIAYEVPPGQAIAVKLPDGSVTVEPNLKNAMQRAIGGKGHVLLNNSEPIRLTGDEALTIGGGRLYIRAARGVRPVLEVDIKGQKPLLTTRSDTALTIVGVTIVARYIGKSKPVPARSRQGGTSRLIAAPSPRRGRPRAPGPWPPKGVP